MIRNRLYSKRVVRHFFLFSFFLFCIVNANELGVIKGVVTDSLTSKPLPYTNVFLSNTSMGSTSGEGGKFLIMGISPGSYELNVSYIGYQQQFISIDINSDDVLIKNIKLVPQTIESEAVLVTVQAKGQRAAINQQLSSKSIVNVVSSSRIQALPDANAAESIGRLPGVSVSRVGGEGTKVIIRGIAPKYNAITLDGVRLASSEPGDRSTDLSMISSSMLDGIEVYKTLTADKDADALGGTVNFKLRKAKDVFRVNMAVEGRDTDYSNSGDAIFFTRNTTGSTILNNAEMLGLNKDEDYKVVPSLEGRLLKKKLGLFIQANLERKNLTSNEFSANYDHKANDFTSYVTQSVALNHIPRDRERNNSAMVLDYRLDGGNISLSRFTSSGVTERFHRSERFDVAGNAHFYELGHSSSEHDLITRIVNIEKQFSSFHAEMKYSQSFSDKNNPNDWNVNFYRVPAGINNFFNTSADPKEVMEAAITDSSKTNLNTVGKNINFTTEKSYTASFDITVPFKFKTLFNVDIKFGGKTRTNNRSYTSEVYGSGAPFISPSSRAAANLIIEDLGRPFNPFNYNIPLSWFVDSTYSYQSFMDDDYFMNYPVSYDMAKQVADFCFKKRNTFASQGAAEAYSRNNYLSTTNNYAGDEELTAAYIMATVNIGQKLTIIPGVRYQSLNTSYMGIRGQQSALSYYAYDHSDTTVDVNHKNFLPNFNLKYKPYNWFDIRLAYTNTISYPDYNTIIPRIDAASSGSVAWNNYNLKPSKSRNYDIYFSFYEDKVGILTIGGFLKKIDNLIYAWSFSKAGLEAKPYYLTDRDPAAQLNYNISTYVNNPFVVNDWGYEIDWQTNFWYFPKPLSGLILNINYTNITSEAKYPFIYAGATSATDVDTSFTDRLIFQPDQILNFSLGYDYKEFSILLSLLYQDDIFTGVNHWPQLRSTTAAYKRWDISMKQGIPFIGAEIYANINNLNNAKDQSVLQMYPNAPRYIERYGTTANIGFRIKL